jgi:predicted glutamine amidotransferase
MCIIVHRMPSARRITDAEYIRMAKGNSDGYGVMWHDGRKVRTFHTMSGAAWIKLCEGLEQIDAEFVAHARITTHGKTNEYNCHPFETTPGTWLMHNGILDIKPIGERSDTRTFAELVLAYLEGAWYDNAGALFLIESYVVDNRSKFVFMLPDGRVIRMNEKAGEFTDGDRLWFSNSSYKSYAYSADPRVTGGWSHGGSLYDAKTGQWSPARGSVRPSFDGDDAGWTGTGASTASGQSGTGTALSVYDRERYPGMADDRTDYFAAMADGVESVEGDPADAQLTIHDALDAEAMHDPYVHERSLAEDTGLEADDPIAVRCYDDAVVCFECVRAMAIDEMACETLTVQESAGLVCANCDVTIAWFEDSEDSA